tara:strand:+ start:184 stop:684 length:501 start_codon:yes stop_codon:yes gene_type:complete
MVDNQFYKNKLLSFSEAFFIKYINQQQADECLHIENVSEKVRSIRTKQEFDTLLNQNTCFGLYNNENKLIAYAIFSIIVDEAELLDINLLKTEQNNGFGSLFLKQCLATLKSEHNINNVILEVAIDNLQAIKAYQKFDYQQIGIRKNYYKNTNGSKTDALVYKISI